MELLDGETLADSLAKTKGPLPLDQVLTGVVVNWTDELRQLLASGGVQ